MAKRFSKQLFAKKLDINILKTVMQTYQIKKLNQHLFSRDSLAEINIIEGLNKIRELLIPYYLKCKARTYLTTFTVKRSVVILRQILKEFNYKIVSREKYKNKKKYISYIIELNDPKSEEDLVIYFD